MANSYYAVARGVQPGIYSTWDECKEQVNGFKGASFQKFKSEEDARSFIIQHGDPDKLPPDFVSQNKQPDLIPFQPEGIEQITFSSNDRPVKSIDVYVDGSYNKETNEYGCGVYMSDGKDRCILTAKGLCRDGGRNVEGEVAASTLALNFLKDRSYDLINIYHDYEGIGKWADKEWSANKSYTKEYAAFVNDCRQSGMNIRFGHVCAHTGVLENEYVDCLAKVACGVELKNAEKETLRKIQDVKGFPDTKTFIANIASSEKEFDQLSF